MMGKPQSSVMWPSAPQPSLVSLQAHQRRAWQRHKRRSVQPVCQHRHPIKALGTPCPKLNQLGCICAQIFEPGCHWQSITRSVFQNKNVDVEEGSGCKYTNLPSLPFSQIHLVEKKFYEAEEAFRHAERKMWTLTEKLKSDFSRYTVYGAYSRHKYIRVLNWSESSSGFFNYFCKYKNPF